MLSILGALLFLAGWLWLVVIAFSRAGVLWGLITLVFNWVGGLIFVLVEKEGGWFQLGLIFLGMAMVYFGGVKGLDFTDLPPGCDLREPASAACQGLGDPSRAVAPAR